MDVFVASNLARDTPRTSPDPSTATFRGDYSIHDDGIPRRSSSSAGLLCVPTTTTTTTRWYVRTHDRGGYLSWIITPANVHAIATRAERTTVGDARHRHRRLGIARARANAHPTTRRRVRSASRGETGE